MSYLISPKHESLQITAQSQWDKGLFSQDHFTCRPIEWNLVIFFDHFVSNYNYLLNVIYTDFRAARNITFSPFTGYNSCVRYHATPGCQDPYSSMKKISLLSFPIVDHPSSVNPLRASLKTSAQPLAKRSQCCRSTTPASDIRLRNLLSLSLSIKWALSIMAKLESTRRE